MKHLSIDLETRSSVDLGKSSVYRYVESPDFDILLFGYSVDDSAVQVIDLALGEQIPPEIIKALTDPSVFKHAYNASFERICLSAWLRRQGYPLDNEHYSVPDDPCMTYIDPRGWRCTMVWAAYMGLPLSLRDVGAVLGLDKQKMEEGKELIRFFCQPDRDGNWRDPADYPEKWSTFKAYNLRDVETEMGIQQRLQRFPVPEDVWDQYCIDQQINDRGIGADMQLVRNAIAFDERSHEQLVKELQKITGLANPNSPMQMLGWLSEHGMQLDSLDKKNLGNVLKTAAEPMRSALLLRQQLAKASVKKYQAIENTVCADGRVRGCFQFYGANRTGRFSGRNVQLQNLARNDMPDLKEARELVRQGNYEAVEALYDSVPDVLSQLVRTSFIPRKGMTYFVADYSAIEARVIAWLANEEWRMELFRNGGDIYCQSASQMFKVPVVKHGVNGHLRQKGKIAELACIAQGQRVLTDQGVFPIEQVTLQHRLWDGTSWVRHEGLVYRGEREVITYEGLTATPDHLVWVEGRMQPISLGTAVANKEHLLRITGIPDRHHTTPTYEKAKVYDILNAGPRHRFTVSGHLVHNCGYGGSVGALTAMGALEMGLKEDELKPLVDAWRESNPNIVKLWWCVDDAATKAVEGKCRTSTHGLKFNCQSGMLFITLPSGRNLSYVKPIIGENKFGGRTVTYMGIDSTHRWSRIESFPGRWVENCVQAISRDILCYAMQTLRNCSIVAHVHDELIIEADPRMSLETICEQMGRTPPWAEGLILRADGYTTPFYMKD